MDHQDHISQQHFEKETPFWDTFKDALMSRATRCSARRLEFQESLPSVESILNPSRIGSLTLIAVLLGQIIWRHVSPIANGRKVETPIPEAKTTWWWHRREKETTSLKKPSVWLPLTWKDGDVFLQRCKQCSPTWQCTCGALVGLMAWPLAWQGWTTVLAAGGSAYVFSEVYHYVSAPLQVETILGATVSEIVVKSLDKIRAATRHDFSTR